MSAKVVHTSHLPCYRGALIEYVDFRHRLHVDWLIITFYKFGDDNGIGLRIDGELRIHYLEKSIRQ